MGELKIHKFILVKRPLLITALQVKLCSTNKKTLVKTRV